MSPSPGLVFAARPALRTIPRPRVKPAGQFSASGGWLNCLGLQGRRAVSTSVRVQQVAEIRLRIREAGIPLIGESPAFVSLLGTVERAARCTKATMMIRRE